MAVAQAIYSRKQRDYLRKILGPECVFIVLNMSNECAKKRIIGRHGDSLNEDFLDRMIKLVGMFEPAGADEENAYNVEITEDMTQGRNLLSIFLIGWILPANTFQPA